MNNLYRAEYFHFEPEGEDEILERELYPNKYIFPDELTEELIKEIEYLTVYTDKIQPEYARTKIDIIRAISKRFTPLELMAITYYTGGYALECDGWEARKSIYRAMGSSSNLNKFEIQYIDEFIERMMDIPEEIFYELIHMLDESIIMSICMNQYFESLDKKNR